MEDADVQEKTQGADLAEIQPQILSDISKMDLSGESWEVLVQMGMQALEIRTYSQWVLGKIANALLDYHHGDLKKYAEATRIDYTNLTKFGKTYKAFIDKDPNFHPSKYGGSIPWGVLQLAATVAKDDPQAQVDKWHDENNGSLKAAIRDVQVKKHGDLPAKPTITLTWNPEVKKYSISIELDDFEKFDWEGIKQDLKAFLESV